MGLISTSATPILYHYFSNCSIFMNLNKATSWLNLVFKTWSTQECLCYCEWKFLLYVVWETPYLPTVSSAKFFQGFKILKNLQNTVYMSFYLFIQYIYRFSIKTTFLNIEYPLVVWASLLVCPPWSPKNMNPDIEIFWNYYFGFYEFINKGTVINL